MSTEFFIPVLSRKCDGCDSLMGGPGLSEMLMNIEMSVGGSWPGIAKACVSVFRSLN